MNFFYNLTANLTFFFLRVYAVFNKKMKLFVSGREEAFQHLSSIKQEKLLKFSSIIFIISLISLILVPVIGVEVKGSKRWIDLYFLPRFQPIELVKPFLIIFISLILSSEKYINIYYERSKCCISMY